MKRILLIALTTTTIGVLLALTAHAQLAGPASDPARDRTLEEEQRMHRRMALIDARVVDPDKSKNWRALGPDLGVLLREDDTFGYRGRLYARIDGDWVPVSLDGIESIGAVPLRQ